MRTRGRGSGISAPGQPSPRQEQAGSCLPGLAMGAGRPRGVHLEPMAGDSGRASQLCPELVIGGGWEERQEDPGAFLLHGRHVRLAWPAAAWWEDSAWRRGFTDEATREPPGLGPHLRQTWSAVTTAEGGRPLARAAEWAASVVSLLTWTPTVHAWTPGSEPFLYRFLGNLWGCSWWSHQGFAPAPSPESRHPHPSFQDSGCPLLRAGSEAIGSCPGRDRRTWVRQENHCLQPSPGTQGEPHLKQVKGHDSIQIRVQSFEEPCVSKKR